MRRYFLPLAAVAALLAGGCSSSIQPAAMLPATAQQAPAHGAVASGKHLAPILPDVAARLVHRGQGTAEFVMNWKRHGIDSRARPQYIPKTARSISLSINGGEPQYLNAPNSVLKVVAPAGVDTFLVKSYDEQNGLGNVLSLAYITQTVVAKKIAIVKGTLNAVVASFTVMLTAAAKAGKPATIPIDVTAYDPDDNVIVGASDYDNPILLSADTAYSGTVRITTPDVYRPGIVAHVIYDGGTLASATILGQSAALYPSSTSFSPVPTVYECTAAGSPQYIVAGRDGNMWFTDSNNTVVRVDNACSMRAFTIPTGSSIPQGMALGGDGNVWFAEYGSSKIAKITTAGVITEFGTLFGSDGPLMVADRGDGTMWYTANAGNRIGYEGEFFGNAGETAMPSGGSGPWGLAEGPDGNLYIGENNLDGVARLPSLFAPPAQTGTTAGSLAEQMVAGPDGNLWFVQNGLAHIGVLSPSAFVQSESFPTYSPSSAPVGITVGKDGALWYTENGLDRIARMTVYGQNTNEYKTLSTNTGLKGIATAPDGSIWFCESGTSKVGRLVY